MREAIFMSAITASMTHELQNVLAIINECRGLMSDVLALNPGVKLKRMDMITKSLTMISEQIERGKSLSGSLNRFAHTNEDFPMGADLNRIVQQMGLLAERIARLRKCEFVMGAAKEPVVVAGNGVLLLMAVYEAMRACLTSGAEGRIHVEVSRDGQRGSVHFFLPEGAMVGKDALSADLWAVAGQLTADVEIDAAGKGLDLYFPLSVQ
jgi:C4-dicarboxylate-specific signal transduction histidine kinase